LSVLVNSADVSASVSTRARIVLWRAEGRPKVEVAALAGVSRPTVDLWLSRFATASPQLRHVVVRDVHALAALDERGELAARPVRQTRLGRWAGPGQRQDPTPNRGRHLLPRCAPPPVQQPGNATGGEAGQPQIHRRPRHPSQGRDLHLRSTLGSPQHDPRPRRHRRRHISAIHQHRQLGPLLRRQLHRRSQPED
jgi:hypothetical protein